MNKRVEFDYKDIITYEKCQNIINELESWYKGKRELLINKYHSMLLKKEYYKSTEIMRFHNGIIKELIRRIISYLDLKDKDFGVYLSNSFARETNLLNSDVDLNFMYEDKSLYVYEELISSILASTLSKYRDFVHDSISHRMSIATAYEEDILLYELNFPDKVILKDITKGNISIMYKLYHTQKNKEAFIKYYIKYINQDEINEWIYSQSCIFENDGYVTSLLDYIKHLGNGIKDIKINVRLDIIKKEIEEELNNINNIKIDDIQKLKKYFKNNAFKIINEFLLLSSSNYEIESSINRLDRLSDSNIANKIKLYLGHIMIIDYICELYGIEFRTRYSQPIKEDFKKFYKDKTEEELDTIIYHAKYLYESILNSLNNVKVNDVNDDVFDVKTEHINIEAYSPLWKINQVSKEYQDGYYLMPFIEYQDNLIPVHPDLLDDLNISRKKIVKEELVYPTSSTRTVYQGNKNICYKLPVKRKITRSIRDLSSKELNRSEIASSYLAKYNYNDFEILKEECHYNENELYNYIIRKMPNKKVYPWFYLIVSNKFSKEFMMNIIKKLIDIWMYYASNGIYFESFHTQNLLVSEDGIIYYRDLSDIRILNETIMTPSYMDELENESEMHSIFFDRSLLSQNIEHFIKYRKDITEKDIEKIKQYIYESQTKYNISFPNYSMDYDKSKEGHHPIKGELVRLRKL